MKRGVQLTPDGFYEIRARAVDKAGNAGVLSSAYVISNDPPAPPAEPQGFCSSLAAGSELGTNKQS